MHSTHVIVKVTMVEKPGGATGAEISSYSEMDHSNMSIQIPHHREGPRTSRTLKECSALMSDRNMLLQPARTCKVAQAKRADISCSGTR
mmetsp:Transcript_18030/g.37378  ORF Transcript_18030/g.37378 Transcript_18030/m.37378 type:complete len:89 (-) Transcript_18030:1483-1749(-)